MVEYTYTFRLPANLPEPLEIRTGKVVFVFSNALTPEEEAQLDAFMLGKGYDKE